MTTSNIVDLLVGVVVLAYILAMQLRARPIRGNQRLPLILGIIGVVELVQYLGKGHHGAGVVAALAGSLVIAAVFGAVRAATVKIWVEGGQGWRQGNWLTAVLWVVSLGAHLGYDYLVEGKGANAGLGDASLLLYFAVTFLVQGLIMQARAQKTAGGPGQQGPGRPPPPGSS